MRKPSSWMWVAPLCLVTSAWGDELTQPDLVDDLEEIPLEALLDTEIGVTARREESIRKASGVVTVITGEEIRASGARDLIDVLQQVPGFTVHSDVQGALGVGFRGNWGHEGKVLLLVDGVEWNEMLYSTAPIGDRLPVDQIERIEIIRGPGSVAYGGNAELAVIHVITRKGNDRGVSVRASYGVQGRGVERGALSGSFGQVARSLDDVAVSGTFLIGRGPRSARAYRDFDGTTVDMSEESVSTPAFATASASWRDLRVRYIVDRYAHEDRTGLDSVLPRTTRVGFAAQAADAQLDLELSPSFTLTPRVGWLRQTPWQVTDPGSPAHYDKTADRYAAGATLAWSPSDNVHALVGSETSQVREGETSYHDVAAFGQLGLENEIANLTLGLRGESHSAFGESVVPRVALTRVMGSFHAKVLYARSFRAPGIENMNLGQDIRPERTETFEGEVGVQLDQHLSLTANAFDITIRDPIIYFVDAGEEGYRNYRRTGSRGVEVQARGGVSRLRGSLGWSFASATGKNEVDLYRVPQREDVLLGMPRHKLTGAAQLTLVDGLVFAPSATWLGRRYAYLEADAGGEPMVGVEDPDLLLTLYLRWRDLGAKGTEVGAGVFDVFDSGLRYLQPYQGGHAPIPAASRELVFRVGYSSDF